MEQLRCGKGMDYYPVASRETVFDRSTLQIGGRFSVVTTLVNSPKRQTVGFEVYADGSVSLL